MKLSDLVLPLCAFLCAWFCYGVIMRAYHCATRRFEGDQKIRRVAFDLLCWVMFDSVRVLRVAVVTIVLLQSYTVLSSLSAGLALALNHWNST